MLKDRSTKGSWKGANNNQRRKKSSYGDIHSINDRGIHEIYKTLGGVANGGGGPGGAGYSPGGSAPTSPWSSPLMGRKAMVSMSPSHQADRQ